MISKAESTRRKKKKKFQSRSFLPEEITENILARVSRWNYPKLSLVSKSFRSILSSMNICKTRSQIGTTETCLYICLISNDHKSYRWFTLQAKPNQSPKENSSGNVLIPIDYLPVPNNCAVAVGSEIYAMGGAMDSEPSSTVRVLDCQSHTWRNAPNMKMARQGAEAVCIDENIYVMGGCKSMDHSFEVFDIKTQSWTSLPSPCDMYSGCPIVVQGKLHVTRDYTYDPKQGTWEVVSEPSMFGDLELWCVVENVICCCTKTGDCMWYDIEGGNCEMIKGLETLREHPIYTLSADTVHDLVNYGGNLLVIWKPEQSHDSENKIWYAEISLETRCNGSEIWGNVEWVDVMFTLPESYNFLHCINVSV